MKYDETRTRWSDATAETVSSCESLILAQEKQVPLNLSWNDLKDVHFYTSTSRSFMFTANYEEKPVMIKTPHPNLRFNSKCLQEIETEMEILSMLDHPNIVKLYGAGITAEKTRFLVLEHLDGGTLEYSINNVRCKKNSWRIFRKMDKNVRLKDSLRDACEIAKAMEYCHSDIDESMILHRDLKPDNIGYTSNGTLKVMDFGLARLIDNCNNSTYSNNVYKLTGGTGSLRYMAPESAKHESYNHKVDVYSFGIILWEMLTCKRFCDGFDRDSFIEEVINGGKRPTFTPNRWWPAELIDLMERCWNSDIEKRPSFRDIIITLETIISTRTTITTTTTNNSSRSKILSPLKKLVMYPCDVSDFEERF